MGERIEIGIVFIPSAAWVGGVYYILNLVSALNVLDDAEKPIVHVFSENEDQFNRLKRETAYPYLVYNNYKKANKVEEFLIKVQKAFSPNHYYSFCKNKVANYKISFVYPSEYGMITPKEKVLSWIPDFQDMYLPELFSQKELDSRGRSRMRMVKNRIPIVFSSEDAQHDFDAFYPNHNNQTFVLRFAVTHPKFEHLDITEVLKKYEIASDYIFCANQFWTHKNHMYLFEAYKKAKDRGFNKKLLCSGSLKDYRDKDYSKRLQNFINDNGLQKDIIVLGFIDREDQLLLMKNSYAIVQPSLFEGWSTVVEDAKALNKFIFLSNLKVHIEQAPGNVSYFDPRNVDDLVDQLLNIMPTQTVFSYKEKVKQFANDFMSIVNRVNNN